MHRKAGGCDEMTSRVICSGRISRFARSGPNVGQVSANCNGATPINTAVRERSGASALIENVSARTERVVRAGDRACQKYTASSVSGRTRRYKVTVGRFLGQQEISWWCLHVHNLNRKIVFVNGR